MRIFWASKIRADIKRNAGNSMRKGKAFSLHWVNTKGKRETLTNYSRSTILTKRLKTLAWKRYQNY